MKLLDKRRRARPSVKALIDATTTVIIVTAFLLLVSLIYYYVRPIRTVSINVPVVTDKAEYKRGEIVSGIFNGEVFYEGRVETKRKMVCEGYTKILSDQRDGDNLVENVSRPRKLDNTLATIAPVPADAPLNKQCFIEFVNLYEIVTPFGQRNETATYYTQGFKIID